MPLGLAISLVETYNPPSTSISPSDTPTTIPSFVGTAKAKTTYYQIALRKTGFESVESVSRESSSPRSKPVKKQRFPCAICD